MADTDTSKIKYSSGYTYNTESWQQSSETSTSTQVTSALPVQG